MKQVLSSSVQRKNEEEGSEKRRKLKKGRQISKEGNYFDNHKLPPQKNKHEDCFHHCSHRRRRQRVWPS